MTHFIRSGGDPGGGPSGDPLSLALAVADAVDGLANLWSVAAQGASLRLSPHQLRALRILETAPGLNLTALAERIEIGLPTASRLCDRLEAAGLLERGLHPHKRREVRLNLTPHGRHVLDEVASRRSRALAGALAVMASAEREALVHGLRGFLSAQADSAQGAEP